LQRTVRNIFTVCLIILIFLLSWKIPANVGELAMPGLHSRFFSLPDTTLKPDTVLTLPFAPPKQDDYLLYTPEDTGGFYLRPPKNLKSDVEYDPETNEYYFSNKIGNLDYRNPTSMSFDEYRKFDLNQSLKKYWRERSQSSTSLSKDGIIPSIYIGGQVFDRIFGSNTIDIRPQGSAELTFGVLANKREDPTLNVRQQKTVNFDFEQNIQMNVQAKIGDKIQFNTNFNTQAVFDFENKLKLNYEGKEDEIIKLIEAGDVSMPLSTTLIQGTQSLFGFKAKLQFGRTTVTGLFSEQESQSNTVVVENGAQTQKFLLKATDYEENKHFFMAHLFRQGYDHALSSLPIISSDVNITRIEVWVTNIGPAVQQNRNLVAFQDLGENSRIGNQYVHPTPGIQYPSNNANDLLSQMDINQLRSIGNVGSYLNGDPFSIGYSGYMVNGQDYEKIESARKLESSEYSYNPKLGFISLYTTLNSDQALAVAFQYTVIGIDSVFQVGEFTDQSANTANCLVVKLLKSSSLSTNVPMWDLMMKNVYSIGAYRISAEKFILNILYSGNPNGVPTGYFTEGPDDVQGIPLIQVFNFDNLDQLLNPPADGLFDFLDNAGTQGGTINSSNGRLYFTVIEPFGDYIKNKFGPAYPELANKYSFDTLYRASKTIAEQQTEKNKYQLEGFYSSESGAEIDLNAFNIPRGSVRVTAGGRTLTENSDYTVDYTLGRVRIINEGILNSGLPISISTENQANFSVQKKRLMGLRLDHQIGDKWHFGGTLLNLTERPLTQKVDYGNDPISNTVWGMDGSYQGESRLITSIVDKLPGIDTKEPSKVNVEGEFASFIPGHSKAIGRTGVVYIDDFEGAKSTIDLRNVGTWFLASTPQGQADIFPEAYLSSRAYGYNRAKTAWYTVDPLFYDRNNNLRPRNIDKDELSKNTVREILESEVFPNKEYANGIPTNIPVFNVAFYPSERGPYNYDVDGTPNISQGIDENGNLNSPESRWGGIMRKIESTDFEATNVEYIEFWMMDPFNSDAEPGNKGRLYINLGDISEDILKDGQKFFENGLPGTETFAGSEVDTTIWGRVPTEQNLVESFDNDAATRPYQDVGYDGLRDQDEVSFFGIPYIEKVQQLYGPTSLAYMNAIQDPSGDDYHYFRGTDFDNNDQYSSILERYKKYNGPDGNSPTDAQNSEDYPVSATTLPNVEDLNRDNTLSETERYFQYQIELDPDKMKVGENYITDTHLAQGVPLANGSKGEVTWYQFKVPVQQPTRVVGNISDFKSIRFMRMFVNGFEKPVVLRFATLELVRGEWRKYKGDLLSGGEYIPDDIQSLTTFDIFSVNIEENGRRQPIPYVIPPGIQREQNIGTTTLVQLNEQSMVLKVCNLLDGDARAAYKTTDFDFRQYKHLEMFVHAEKSQEQDNLNYGDMTVFIRIGSDFTQNYYEYEVPLTFTPWYTSATDDEAIWPESNQFDIDLEKLVQIKLDRDVQARAGTVSVNVPYVTYDGLNKVTVLGVPSISDVMAIMIGVRNPKKPSIESTDDGLPKCAEIWINELRLTGFNDKAGWAGLLRVNSELGDVGQIVLSTMYSSPNFATLEKKINETQKESVFQWDVATDLNLGKFFPETSGVKVPMHVDYSQTIKTPEYDPLSPDLKLSDELASYDNTEASDSIRKIVQDYTDRFNINFMNVRKDRVGAKKKPAPWDVENFSASYAYSSINQRDIDVEYDTKKTQNGGLGYNFNVQPKNVKPFQNVGFLGTSDAFKLIKDFNFYYLPKQFGFRTEMIKEDEESKLRNKSEGLILLRPTYARKWNWNRNYDLKFDLATSLTLQFRATANSFIRQPAGSLDPNSPWYDKAGVDTIDIAKQFWQGGLRKTYNQALDITYRVPIDKIPFLDWIGLQATYGSIYTWTASPLSVQATMGNTIENSRNIQLNGTIDMTKLYSRIPYLKTLNQSGGGKGNQKGRKDIPSVKPPPKDQKDSTEKKNYAKIIGDQVLKFVMMVKRGNLTYTQGSGILMPGFMPSPQALGVYWPDKAPGIPFVFGSQKDIKIIAGVEGWLTRDTLQNQAYAEKYTENMSARLTLEPFDGFKIELNADRTFTKNHTEFYRMDSLGGDFQSYSEKDMGSFSMSYISWGTAFGINYDTSGSPTFDKMKSYRLSIAYRLADNNPNSVGTVYDSVAQQYYPTGYGPNSQDVIIPAFLAAYGNRNPNDIYLGYFPKIPLPNWRITYDGLTKIKALGNIFRSATLSHAYRSIYSISSYQSNLYYQTDSLGNSDALYSSANSFYPEYDLTQITIQEQFAPLFGIDLSWNNSLMTRFEYKKSRTLTFSMANLQLTDLSTDEIVIGLGYKIKDVSFTVTSLGGGGRKSKITSDLDIKVDFSIRNNRTVLRRVDQNIDQVSSGQRVFSINTSIDYMLSKSVTLRAFFDKIINNPFVSNQYPNSTTKGGISIRFSLAQ
jgi:cell surface protein SprA